MTIPSSQTLVMLSNPTTSTLTTSHAKLGRIPARDYWPRLVWHLGSSMTSVWLLLPAESHQP